jgi:hypothetical protein
MIMHSLSLQRRLVREMERHAGSLASLAFFDGVMPATCDAQANGARVMAESLPEGFFNRIFYGDEPVLPERATYWRVMNNDGECMLQGDCT